MVRILAQLAGRLGLTGNRARKGVWAIADQVSVGGTSFLTTILVGRAAGPAELGQYVLGFVLLIALIAAQESLLTTPFIIFGPKQRGKGIARYTGVALAQYGAQAILFSAGLALAAVAFGLLSNQGLSQILWALSLAVPMRLLLEFVRRLNYADLKLAAAFRVDCTANLVQILLLLLMLQANVLNAASAFAAMGVGAGVSALAWLVPRRKRFPLPKTLFGWWNRHWHIGRWLLAQQTLLFVGLGSLPWMISMIAGDEQTGIFAACLMLENLANPLIVALNNLQSPLASRALANEGLGGMRKLLRQFAALLFGVAVCLSGGLILLGQPLMKFFYGDEFTGVAPILFVFGLKALIHVPTIVPNCGLVVLKRTRVAFQCQLAGMITTVGTAAYCIYQFGVIGAAYGMLAGTIVTGATMTLAYFAIVRQSSPAIVETEPKAGLSFAERPEIKPEGVAG